MSVEHRFRQKCSMAKRVAKTGYHFGLLSHACGRVFQVIRLGFRDEWPACALGCLFGPGNAIQFGIGPKLALSTWVVLAKKVVLQADAWP